MSREDLNDVAQKEYDILMDSLMTELSAIKPGDGNSLSEDSSYKRKEIAERYLALLKSLFQKENLRATT